MTEAMSDALFAVRSANREGKWYRAQTAGERVSLAYLVDHGELCRRAWRGDAFVGRNAAFEYATIQAVKTRQVPSDGTESRDRTKLVPIVAVLLFVLGGCLDVTTSGDPTGSPSEIGSVHTCTRRYACSKEVTTVAVCVPLLGDAEVIDLCPDEAEPKPSCACSFTCEETLKPCVIGGD